MNIIKTLFGVGTPSNPIDAEKRRHQAQMQTYESEIESSKKQIVSLKIEMDGLKNAGNLTASK